MHDREQLLHLTARRDAIECALAEMPEPDDPARLKLERDLLQVEHIIAHCRSSLGEMSGGQGYEDGQ